MKKFYKVLLVVAFTIVFISCSQNSKRPGGVDGSKKVSESVLLHDHADDVVVQTAVPSVKVDNSGALIPEIEKLYKGIKLELRDSKTGKKIKDIDLPFKERIAIEPTPYSILTESYFTSFKVEDSGINNISMREENPASKIKIYKGDEVVFDGWLFQNYPDIHQFVDPEYSFYLIEGVKR